MVSRANRKSLEKNPKDITPLVWLSLKINLEILYLIWEENKPLKPTVIFFPPSQGNVLNQYEREKNVTPLPLRANHSCLNANLMYFKNTSSLVSFEDKKNKK